MPTLSSSHESTKPVNTSTDRNQGDTSITGDSRSARPINAQSSASTTPASQTGRSRAICRFYGTKDGCRAGEACRFRHENSTTSSAGPKSGTRQHDGDTPGSQPQRNRKQRVVTDKPVPVNQQADPRGFEIGQIVKRFTPTRQDTDVVTELSFALQPSDPDFPFELRGGLRCTLTIPVSYPKSASPSLRVSNSEMPKGHQINVENGFTNLARQTPRKSLLALINSLDRQLEQLLTAEKAQTIKFVANAATGDPGGTGPLQPMISSSADQAQVKHHSAAPKVTQHLPRPLAPTAAQKNDARAKREADVRQLEARMGKLALYHKSSDGTMYTIPIQVSKTAELPASLRAVREIVLFVPPLYNIEPCTVHLKGVEGEEAQRVEQVFAEYAKREASATLMARINYLTQNLKTMALPVQSDVEREHPVAPIAEKMLLEPASANFEAVERPADGTVLDPDRPHLKLVQRPPEWDNPGNNESESSDDYTDSSGDDEADSDDPGGASIPTQMSLTTNDHGISVSFPDVELYGIELLELASVSLTLKCERCKTTTDITNLRPSSKDNTITISQSCSKCAYTMSATYRAEPMHAHNVRAGYLDLVSCTIHDMLLSMFVPTCSECSTRFASPPGVMAVRGDTTLSVCRECHQKMTFKIPSVKFLRVSSQQHQLKDLPHRKGPKEQLGITAGTPLPDKGRCSHYRKSYRWFRFSCCNKVYPCDRCHDEKADPKHPNEHGNRMICGWCSREQNFRPNDCGKCGESMIAKKGGGFWNGGQGTRDPMRMSRKEPRKYKRIGAKNKAKESR